MLDKKKYPVQFYLISGIGSGLILSFTIGMTYVFWKYGVEQNIFTNNYSTSVLLTDSLYTATGAAPLALISVNWLACRIGIKQWRKFVMTGLNC